MATDTTSPTTTAPKRSGRKPSAVQRPTESTMPTGSASAATLPGTDAANSDLPLKLSPDAIDGTTDRGLAFDWMEEGHQVRRRNDGVYERLMPIPGTDPFEDEELEFYPDVEMLDRRMLDPNITSDVSILFKDEMSLPPGAKPKYYKRWVDTHVPSRVLILEQRAGYKKSEWSMLADKNTIGDRHEEIKDNVVRRGEKGRYILMFMPYRKWEDIKRAQAELRTSRERTQMTKLAAGMASSAPGIGPQGAEQIDTTFKGSIRELPPQSVEAFQTSGLPKDIATAAVTLEE